MVGAKFLVPNAAVARFVKNEDSMSASKCMLHFSRPNDPLAIVEGGDSAVLGLHAEIENGLLLSE